MANTYKNIVITPNINTGANIVPVIRFSAGDATANADINVRVYTSQNGTLSFEGSAGQLFSITNDLTNVIFSVNDISGIPSLEVDANGKITMATFGGNVGIGTANAGYKLDVAGTANISNSLLIAGVNVMPIVAASYDKANAANVLAFNTGVGANAFTASTLSGVNAISSLAYDQANTARTHANSAFVTANAALPNTSGATFAGNLFVTGNLRANVINSAAGFIDLGPGSRPAYAEGRVYYDNVDKSLTVHNDTTFTYPIGQIEYARVWNESGSTIPKGAPVYATGYHMTNHHHFTVDLADASDPAKYDVIGLVAADIPDASHGYVIVRGWIGGINTASLTVGSRFHLGFAAPGTLVTVAPEYPNYPFDIGYCTVSDATNGYLYVDRQTHTLESLRVIASARVGGDFTVEGDFTVLGQENAITVNSLEVGTQFIYLGAGDSISNANTTFTGSGLNDLEFRGHYEGSTNTSFYVMISDVSPDKFSWSYLSNFSVLQQQNVAIQYQTTQPLSNGISIYFNANTGHTVGDKWNATAYAVSTDFGIVGNHISGPNGYTHAGLFRDETDGAFKFFRSYDPEVAGNIDIANNTFALGNVEVNKITAAEVYEGATRLSDSISAISTASAASFGKANTANITADLAYGKANTANITADLAYDKANAANLIASSSYDKANAANIIASSSYDKANTANITADLAYDKANAANIIADLAYDKANSANLLASEAFDKANSTSYDTNVIISVLDNTNAALRITQTGTAEALRVEDSANPDLTPFVITATGNVGIGTSNPQVPLQSNGMLLVVLNNAPPMIASGEIAEFVHNLNSYAQFHVRNANTGTSASGDLVVTTDTGTDIDEYIDLGVNNSNYNDPTWTINGAKDGYLLMKGGNLAIGTGNTVTMKTLDFFTMGTSAANLRMTIANGVSVGYNTIDPGANNLYVTGHANVSNMNVVPTIQGAYDKANSANNLAATVAINYVIDGGGSAITPGQKGYLEVPFNCTLNTWSIYLDQTGSIAIQVWADTYANFPPTVIDNINAAAFSVTTAQKAQGSVDSANAVLVAGDTLAFNVVSVTTATRATIALKATKT